MPLFAAGVVAYVCGLLLGFAGHATFAFIAACAVVAYGVRANMRVPRALALVAVGGAWVARAAARDDAACVAQLLSAGTIQVTLIADAAPGSFASGTAAACHVDVQLAVEEGAAHAGDGVLVAGDISRSARGLLVQRAVLRAHGATSRIVRWRAAAGVRVDSLFGSDAPLARALLVADRSGLPAEVRSRYAAAGIAHMLSISGLHVALIAIAVELVLELLHVPRQRASLVTLAIVGAYVAMLGAPSPALRAAVMLGVLVCSRRWQRPTSPWAVLAIGAAMPLTDPRAVTGVGYQLSVAGVAALIGASALARRWPWFVARRGAARVVVGTALASSMATVVTAPLVAWYFGRLSLIGPLTNIVAGPVLALAQPMMFLALALSPIAPVAHWFADGARPLLFAFDRIAATASGIPGASIAVAPSALSAALGALFAVALVVACVSRFPVGALLVAGAAAALLACAPIDSIGTSLTELHMIDVGQGSAIALRTTRAHWIVIDAGRAWKSGDAGRSTVVPYVAHRGGSVVAFVLSDAGADNVGGAVSVLRGLSPHFYYDAVAGSAGDAYRASLLEARRRGVAWRRARPGDSLVVDEVTLTFVAPDSGWAAHSSSRASVMIMARVGSVRMVLAGDATAAEERRVVASGVDLRADVLKVARHGAADATTAEFLSAVAPRVALISVGAMGNYGAPSLDVIRRLVAAGAQVLRTDQLSDVVVRTDGRTVNVSAMGDEWPVTRTPGDVGLALPPLPVHFPHLPPTEMRTGRGRQLVDVSRHD